MVGSLKNVAGAQRNPSILSFFNGLKRISRGTAGSILQNAAILTSGFILVIFEISKPKRTARQRGSSVVTLVLRWHKAGMAAPIFAAIVV